MLRQRPTTVCPFIRGILLLSADALSGGPDRLHCVLAVFVQDGKYKHCRAMISHPRGRHNAYEVRGQTFQAKA